MVKKDTKDKMGININITPGSVTVAVLLYFLAHVLILGLLKNVFGEWAQVTLAMLNGVLLAVLGLLVIFVGWLMFGSIGKTDGC